MRRRETFVLVVGGLLVGCGASQSGTAAPGGETAVVPAYQVAVTTASAKADHTRVAREIAGSKAPAPKDELGSMLPAERIIANAKPYGPGDLATCAAKTELKKEAGYTFWKHAACSWTPAADVKAASARVAKLTSRAKARAHYACGQQRCITVPTFNDVDGESGFAECVYEDADTPPSRCVPLTVQATSGGVWLLARTHDRVRTSTKRRGPPPQTTQFVIRAANADLEAIAKSVHTALAAQPLILTTRRSPSGNGFAIHALAKARRSAVLGRVHENLKLDIKLFKPKEEQGVGVRMFVSLYVSRDRRQPIRRWLLPSAQQRGEYERKLLATLREALKKSCSACDMSKMPSVVRWD